MRCSWKWPSSSRGGLLWTAILVMQQKVAHCWDDTCRMPKYFLPVQKQNMHAQAPPPFPTTLLFKHIHARRRAYLNPWSVNSAFVGFHCGAYLWSEGGCTKAVCVHLRVCVWDEMTFPAISGLTPGPITTQNLGLIKCTEGQMPDLQEFPTSASVIFQPSPFLQTWTMACTCSVHSKCETDTSNFPVRLQCMRQMTKHAVVLTLNLSSQELWSSWIIWRGFPCSRMTVTLSASPSLPPGPPAQWPFSCRVENN